MRIYRLPKNTTANLRRFKGKAEERREFPHVERENLAKEKGATRAWSGVAKLPCEFWRLNDTVLIKLPIFSAPPPAYTPASGVYIRVVGMRDPPVI